MKIERFEDLEIWQEARSLCKLISRVTRKDPFFTDFKLRDQIRASSGSIMDNIAEGFERNGNKEFLQFLSFAKGSCGESRSQSYRAFDYDYLDSEVLDDLIKRTTNLSKKISRLMTYLRTSSITGPKFRKP
jgi:four helix bundle protein